ncbi:hypothetical protein SNE40_001154 [Patella caerulea]|uniref:Heparan-sulfate 6-O-sulfotransferase n=1 Tax=Patella caerulea TaxID=87958 RepID=A0AAN8KDX2_PATCE
MTPTKWKALIFFVVFLSASGFFYTQYYNECFLKNCPHLKYVGEDESRLFDITNESRKVSKNDIDFEKEDVIVFLHIQKTGGTFFGRNLVKNLDVDPPCICGFKGKKRCDCFTKNRKIWLFSRYSTGWLCGLHADWTELKSCVESKMDEKEGRHRNRRLHYITVLRNPILRYLSEWKHVARGATWKGSRLYCNGREATLEEVPFCYDDSDWMDVTLDEFLKCPHNLANNRQTRMLADLSKINCYNTTTMSSEERDFKMLQSAKKNLQDMAYFGLTEYQNYSQLLFEETFNVPFIDDFEQKEDTKGSKVKVDSYMERLKERNYLDIKLYEFAKDLFFWRVHNILNITV